MQPCNKACAASYFFFYFFLFFLGGSHRGLLGLRELLFPSCGTNLHDLSESPWILADHIDSIELRKMEIEKNRDKILVLREPLAPTAFRLLPPLPAQTLPPSFLLCLIPPTTCFLCFETFWDLESSIGATLGSPTLHRNLLLQKAFLKTKRKQRGFFKKKTKNNNFLYWQWHEPSNCITAFPLPMQIFGWFSTSKEKFGNLCPGTCKQIKKSRWISKLLS